MTPRLAIPAIVVSLAAALIATGIVATAADAPTPHADAATAPARSTSQPFPGITIDLKDHIVDIDAVVGLRTGEWLELLACSPRSKEHESILVVPAQPSQIHAALLAIGLIPGKPLHWTGNDENAKVVPPAGPKVTVTLRYEKDGKTIEVPANKWIVDQKQKVKKPLADNVWLFVGSVFDQREEHTFYRADMNGCLLSIVNFGDEILARATNMTKDDDNQTWGPNTDEIPPLKTKVTIRLRPVVEEKK